MLKLMRDSFQQLKWILVAIVAIFIVFIFVDWGAGGPTSGSNDKGYAAMVNGETISKREFDRALYYTQKQYEQMYRQPLSPDMIQALGLNKQVLDGLIDQHLLLQQAEKVHLTATPEEVRQKILTIPILNPDGKFVGADTYARFVMSQGYSSPSEFEDELAREITTEKMESALASGVVVSPQAAEAEYKRLSENAKIRYVLYPASRVAATMTISPAEVESYYNANKAKYAHGEQREVKYLVADVNRLKSQIVPTEQDLRKRYEAAKESFKQPEAAHILHILIKVDPNAPPAVDAAAKAKADSLVQQLRAGADFAKLAKENSGDPSSSGNGGDMGWVNRGTTVDPFDSAAFSIPLNTISDPIRSKEFGYHIIKVLERRPESYRAFEDVRPQLDAEARDQMAKDQARDAITSLQQRIKQQKPKTPEQFSALANGQVSSNDTQWFGKGDQIPGLGSNSALISWAFSAKQGDIGDPIGTQRGPAIPYLYQIRPEGISPLSEIRPRVENDAKMAKARELARTTLVQGLPAPNVDELAKKVGLNAADTTVSRQGFISGFSGDTSALIDAAMKAPVGPMQGPLVVGDGAVVFSVIEQHKVQPKTKEETAQYIDALRQQEARSLRTALIQRLRKSAKIDVNQSVVAEGKPAEQPS